jgi:putative heme-binding domain-containing protein
MLSMKTRIAICFALCAFVLVLVNFDTTAKDKSAPPKKEIIPHAQDKPPGPALSPQEAIKKMQVPPGFHVELVAAEPDIVNPVSMTFDERGRIWITESIEYPRRSAGPGKDRVKVLESTKGDGKFDKVTTVIEGLNIPSGIAVGHGGVWVCNAPDILFYPFEDFATPKLGKPQVVVTGFGRDDTHELPNSLTWGPDGWLYGLNGVFNRSVVKQDGKTFDFTCALFKIHPKTKKFEIFCEGTSNPWGLAFNENGDAFVSACVIDHLWHLTETGYYHRQGGPYPPYTWKIGSIVKHRHQKAAYCGLCWFDSDAYPPEYREKMYMGNIHAGAINCDQLAKDGSTYFATPGLVARSASEGKPADPRLRVGLPAEGVGPGADFLVANDAWFMPVAQKVGPDGCMYILDWYDRYHCYQDANRDPAGIDRLQGRLYRVVYKDYKPAGKIDLSHNLTSKDYPDRTKSVLNLIKSLESPNIYFRETAQRLLRENCRREFEGASPFHNAFGTSAVLQKYVLDDSKPRKSRLNALWTLIGAETFDDDFLKSILDHKDPTFRAWGVRAGGNRGYHSIHFTGKRDNIGWINDRAAFQKILALAKDPSPEVQVQVAIAARTLKDYLEVKPSWKPVPLDSMPVLLDVLAHCGDDKLIPHIVWQNLHPLLEKDGDRFLELVNKIDDTKAPGLVKLMPRAIDRILGNSSSDPAALIAYVEKLAPNGTPRQQFTLAVECLAALTTKVQSGEMSGKQLADFKQKVAPFLKKAANEENKHIMRHWAIYLAVSLGEKTGEEYVARNLENDNTVGDRLGSLNALISGRSKLLEKTASQAMANGDFKNGRGFRALMLTRLGAVNEPWVAESVLQNYPNFNGDEQAKAIELLTQRPGWAKSLFKEIAAKNMSKDVINVNQARRLLATKDAELTKLIEKHWGIPRDGRNPEREKIAAQMKELYKKTPGDPKAGVAHFKKVCAQCHKLYGEGADVGPDITSNGRSDFDQLLSNIFDPSLVIGAGYNAVTVNTKQGQTLTGLLVEDNEQRVVLKVQGGERKTIARKDVDEQFASKLSMMPEDLEKQLRPQEIVDLLAYLSLDRPPDDPKARKIPGTPR